LNREKTKSGIRKVNSSPLMPKASIALALMLVMFGGTPYTTQSAMASQTATTTTAETQPTLTPEQEQRNSIHNTPVAITQSLDHGEMQVNGIVYTPR
jgi:hypothetical protein